MCRFETKVPLGIQLIYLHLYSLNLVISKQADAILNSYIGTDLTQYYMSLWPSPLVCVTKKSGDTLESPPVPDAREAKRDTDRQRPIAPGLPHARP